MMVHSFVVWLFCLRSKQKKSPPNIGAKTVSSRYHPNYSPVRGHLSHPVTRMNRSAPRGLLQSGCFAAWTRGFHRSPLASVGFAKLALSLPFRYEPKLLYPFCGICQRFPLEIIPFFLDSTVLLSECTRPCGHIFHSQCSVPDRCSPAAHNTQGVLPEPTLPPKSELPSMSYAHLLSIF